MPNPTQFNFAPGTVISSSQVNSNNYGLEVQIFALIAGLNGCSWVPGATIGAVSITSPLSGSLTTCTSNTGTGVTLSLALTGTVPAGNLPATVAYQSTAPVFSGLVPASSSGFTITNAANSANNLALSDLGALTTRNGVSAGGSIVNSAGYVASVAGFLAGGYSAPTAITPLSLGASTATAMDLTAYASGATLAVLNNAGASYMPISGGTYTNASDARFKRDIRALPDELATVARLRPVSYDWRATGAHDIGFVGQEVAPVLPALVHRDRRGYYLLNYAGVIPVLVRAMQEQQREIARLQAQLKGRTL